MGFVKGLQNQVETAVGNEQSVFKPLKVYCNYSVSKHNWAFWYSLFKYAYSYIDELPFVTEKNEEFRRSLL